MIFWRRLWAVIHENPSTINAISSMMIAALSLYFTVNAQRLDLEYKEVSIQPRMSLIGLGENMSMNLRNLGLGPAVVTRVVLKVDGRCISTATSSDAEWSAAFVKFVNQILPDVFTKALSPTAWKGKKGYDVESDTLYVNDTIRAGEDRYIVRLDPGSMIAENALADLDADYEFLRRESDDEIICPTCGTIHSNDFANKFSLISDVDTCRGFLIEVRREIEVVDAQILERKDRLRTFSGSIERINGILDEQRGELKLRDLIEGESEKLMDSTFAAEEKEIDSQIGAQEMKSDEAAQSMKSFDDKKRQESIKGFYLQQMKSFVQQLQVSCTRFC